RASGNETPAVRARTASAIESVLSRPPKSADAAIMKCVADSSFHRGPRTSNAFRCTVPGWGRTHTTELASTRVSRRVAKPFEARNPDPRPACPEGQIVRRRPVGALTRPGNAPDIPFMLRRREEVGRIKTAAPDAFGSGTRGTTCTTDKRTVSTLSGSGSPQNNIRGPRVGHAWNR